uniref:hypothetical protein n=1 Tax=Tayloriella tenebrosa TaxID=1917049 RepID=UPI0022FD9306|nr:hypothetical protein PN023_pgp192 [Tayloriella tenebrosa]WAX03585.1 hypothetical protein [Tayloriella tenebrosa]
MCNSILFFRLYLLIVLILLCIFSFFLSMQLFRLLSNNLKFLFLLNSLKKQMNLNEDNYKSLISLYLLRGNLFLSVALSELMLEIDDNFIQKEFVYDSLAYAYYYNSFYHIAEYYYLRILSISPHNYKVILNLANIYFDLGYKAKASDMFFRASKYEVDDLL